METGTRLCGDDGRPVSLSYYCSPSRGGAKGPPVGQAAITLREKIIAGEVPGLKSQEDLFSDAIGHARPPLQALAAYCHFAVIYRRNPAGLPVPAVMKNADENEKLNRLLQDLAWAAVTRHPLSGVKAEERKQGQTRNPIDGPPDFDRTVAPVLLEHCTDCHGGPRPKGGLDLTHKEAALKGSKGGPAVVPSKPGESLLWQRVDAGEMPPKKPLPDAARAVLRDWIAAGAAWGTDPLDPFRVTTSKRAGADWWALHPCVRLHHRGVQAVQGGGPAHAGGRHAGGGPGGGAVAGPGSPRRVPENGAYCSSWSGPTPRAATCPGAFLKTEPTATPAAGAAGAAGAGARQ